MRDEKWLRRVARADLESVEQCAAGGELSPFSTPGDHRGGETDDRKAIYNLAHNIFN